MLIFSSSMRTITINKNPSQESTKHSEFLDGSSLNHKSGVHFGVPNSLAKFIYGTLIIDLLTKEDSDLISQFFIECQNYFVGFTMQSSIGYDFGFDASVNITDCRLKDVESMSQIITPRAGKVKFTATIPYVANRQTIQTGGIGIAL